MKTLLVILSLAVVAFARPRCKCTMEYDPICDTNGRTHGNRCTARCSGAVEAYPGPCNPSPVQLPVIEPARRDVRPVQLPVEGVPAQLPIGVPEQLPEISKRSVGPVQLPNICICQPINDPVCGSDGVTYNSPCDATCAGAIVRFSGDCRLRPVPSKRDVVPAQLPEEGVPAQLPVIEPARRDVRPVQLPVEGVPAQLPIGAPEQLPEPGIPVQLPEVSEEECGQRCKRIYDPVCARNQVTYNNECLARCAQATISFYGECGF